MDAWDVDSSASGEPPDVVHADAWEVETSASEETETAALSGSELAIEEEDFPRPRGVGRPPGSFGTAALRQATRAEGLEPMQPRGQEATDSNVFNNDGGAPPRGLHGKPCTFCICNV